MIGCAGSTPADGSVISSWCRTGAIATPPPAPASPATCRTHAPAASTTASAASMDLASVSTPAARPPENGMPTTASDSSISTPWRRHAAAYARTRLIGSSM